MPTSQGCMPLSGLGGQPWGLSVAGRTPGSGKSLRSGVLPQGSPLTLALAPAPPPRWDLSRRSSVHRTSSLMASLRSAGRSSSSRTGECGSWLLVLLVLCPFLIIIVPPLLPCSGTPLGGFTQWPMGTAFLPHLSSLPPQGFLWLPPSLWVH